MRLSSWFAVCLAFVSVLLFSESARADLDRSRDLSLGLQLNDFNGDFGMGLNLTSPFFLGGAMAVRMSGGVVFSSLNDWEAYYSGRVGCVGTSGVVAGFARFYGEGGVQVVVPDPAITSESVFVGGYGQFGFEFFLDPGQLGNSYFIELGASGVGASADKLPGEPIFFNGFSIGVGYRAYF